MTLDLSPENWAFLKLIGQVPDTDVAAPIAAPTPAATTEGDK